jgi:hypothetical protein
MEENKVIYVLLIIILLIVVVNFFKNDTVVESFKNDKLNYLTGSSNNKFLGNPILPRKIEQIIINKKVGNFNKNNKLLRTEYSKLLVDNNEKLFIHKNGSIVIEFNKNKSIDSFYIKGLKTFRIDISSNENSNEFVLLFYGKGSNNHIFTKENINIINNIQNVNQNINARKIKITNLDDNYSNAIKLEIYTKEGLFNKKRNNRVNINDFILKDENLNEINPHSKYYVTSKNIKDSMINISSKQKINAFSLQTNIPYLGFLKTNEKKIVLLGGDEGNKTIYYYINDTNEFNLIPLIESQNIYGERYFIRNIKVYNSSIKSILRNNNNTEGFQNPSNDMFKDEIRETLSISKACEALENEEALLGEKQKLESYKANNVILTHQMRQIEELENAIETLTNTRNEDLKIVDKRNLARLNKMKAKENKIKETLYKNVQKSDKLKFNVNLIDIFDNANSVTKDLTQASDTVPTQASDTVPTPPV